MQSTEAAWLQKTFRPRKDGRVRPGPLLAVVPALFVFLSVPGRAGADTPFIQQQFSIPQDWSGDNALQLSFANLSPNQQVAVTIDDQTGHRVSGQVTLGPAPGPTATFLFDPTVRSGMNSPPFGLTSLTGISFDYAHVAAWTIYPVTQGSLVLTDAKALHYTLSPIIDAFGQYTGGSWPGKVESVADMIAAHQEEQAALESRPGSWDAYGGWTQGPSLPATGHFRTTRAFGRWWLVTPEGRLFFATAMNAVNKGDYTIAGPPRQLPPGQSTPYTGRAGLFESLPADPRDIGYGIGAVDVYTTYNFYFANLFHSYGGAPNFIRLWTDLARRRLDSWGFNTLGFGDETAANTSAQMPYTPRIQLTNFIADAAVPYNFPLFLDSNGANASAWVMPDIFDPRYQAFAEQTISRPASACQADARCIGSFIDNEIPWDLPWAIDWILPRSILLSTQTAAKPVFVSHLKAQYGDIALLNAAWRTSFASWDQMEQTRVSLPSPLPPTQSQDLQTFLAFYMASYYHLQSTLYHAYAPDSLYLGSRLVTGTWSTLNTPDFVQAMTQDVDVVSFNNYEPELLPKEWSLTDNWNKPCMISEFSFGAPDRGFFAPGVPDQAARADSYTRYVESVLARPAFVGLSWHKYIDDPVTGDLSGENNNCGFISNVDIPYPELVRAAAATNRVIYERLARILAPI